VVQDISYDVQLVGLVQQQESSKDATHCFLSLPSIFHSIKLYKISISLAFQKWAEFLKKVLSHGICRTL